MAITITKPTNIPFLEGFLGSSGGDEFRIRTIQMDSSYPSGGYGSAQGFTSGSLGFPAIGMKTLGGMQLLGVAGGAAGIVTPYLDRTNSKLLALRNEGAVPSSLVIEESVTITANAGRLANVPAYILACEQKTGGTLGAATIVPTGSTLATKQVDVNFTNGNVKTFSTDAVTKLLVTYIPMGVGPFVPANLVIDESVALPNGTTVNLANQADLVQYVYDVTGAIPLPVVGTTNAPGSGQIQINLANGANTTITDNAAQNGHTGKATYWKHSALGTPFAFTNNASVNASSNVIAYATTAGVLAVGGPCIPGYGVHHAAYATNTDKPSLALGPSGTPAANSPVYDPIRNTITFAAGDSITREFFGFIVLAGSLMNTFSNEVAPGTNLSGVTFTAMFIGS